MWFGTALGYALHPLASAATPFRMQATDLGSYLLYGPDGRMPAARDTGGVAPDVTADASADWAITDGIAALQLTNVATGQNLSVGLCGRLIQSDGANRRWRFDAADGCATFPEISVNVDGMPAPPAPAPRPRSGALWMHTFTSPPSNSSVDGSTAGGPGAGTAPPRP